MALTQNQNISTLACTVITVLLLFVLLAAWGTLGTLPRALILLALAASVGAGMWAMRGEQRGALRLDPSLRELLDAIQEPVLMADHVGTVRKANHSALTLAGGIAERLQGRPLALLLECGWPPLEAEGRTWLRLDGTTPLQVGYHHSTLKSATNDATLHILTLRSLDQERKAEQRLREVARSDPLTLLPNRKETENLLEMAVTTARSGAGLAFISIDIDHFKDVNASYGQQAGDHALQILAERLRFALPAGSIVGRLGSDQFAVVVSGSIALPMTSDQALLAGKRLLGVIREPFTLDGRQINLTACAGIAIFPEHGDHGAALATATDAALLRAKQEGADTLQLFDPAYNVGATERLSLKSKLRQSYQKDELLLRYQPKVDLRTGLLNGAEALVRWRQPEHGLVLPSEFIPLAEETRLILEIGEWVLERVCMDFREFRAQGEIPGRIAINLSLLQLRQPDFLARVAGILERHQVPAKNLQFEITETTLMKDRDHSLKVLNDLKDTGVSLAIDDFGTGYSSLSILQQLPVETLKIDRSFLFDTDEASSDQTILRAVISMGRQLGLQLVAEGVESVQQLALLRKLNCDQAQGLLFGQPMSATNLKLLFDEERQGIAHYRRLFP